MLINIKFSIRGSGLAPALFRSRRLAMKKNNKAIDEVNERLREGTLSLFEKNRYKDYLKAVSHFPTYSANNQILIFCQDPNATMVCGYNDWQKHKRHVVKGGKGIKILAPKKKKEMVEKKDAHGNTVFGPDGKPVLVPEWKFIGFCTKTVFDVSQTAGDPIPGSITAIFSGNVDGYTELMTTMESVSPVPIQFDENRDEYGFIENEARIAIRKDLSQQQIVQNLLPSIASALLFKSTGISYEKESLEAESIAYVVASQLGIESDYDFDYISDWYDGRSLDELSETLKLIHSVSTNLIKDITAVAKKAAA